MSGGALTFSDIRVLVPKKLHSCRQHFKPVFSFQMFSDVGKWNTRVWSGSGDTAFPVRDSSRCWYNLIFVEDRANIE